MNSTSPHIRALPQSYGAVSAGIAAGGTALAVGTEQRRRAQRWPAKAMGLSAVVGDVAVELLDVSGNGMALRLPDAVCMASSKEVEVDLFQSGVRIARLGLNLTHASPAVGGSVVGGRIVRTGIQPSGRPPAPKVGDIVELRDEALRNRVLQRLTAKSLPAVMRCESGATLPGVVAAGAGSTLAFRTTDTKPMLPNGETVSVEVTLHSTELVLQGTAKTTETGECTFSPITRILSVCRRRCERVPLLAGIGTVSWENPLDMNAVVTAPLIDLSPEGLALEIPAGSTQVLPAAPASLTLRVRGTSVALLGEVHNVRTTEDGSTIVGVHVKPLRTQDKLRLGRLCQALRFPNLLSRRHANPSEVGELFRASGYLGLRDGTSPTAAWCESPGDESLGIDMLHRADGGALLGHLSCTRIYPNTWLYHQLATVGLRRDRVAYPLYIQLMDWISALTNGEGYALAYFDQQKSWHRTMLAEFTRWAGSESLSLVAPLDRFERMTGFIPGQPSAASNVVVREARTDELELTAALARSHLPPLLADALHFHAPSMSARALCAEHSAFDLDRGRTTLVVELDGSIAGAAVCETGAASLSLFNILNMAHVFFRDLLAPSRARVVQAVLLNRVQSFYADRGVTLPLIVSPAGNTQFASEAGLAHAEIMGAWVTSFGGLKQWRNYIHFEMGGLAQRGRRQEKKT